MVRDSAKDEEDMPELKEECDIIEMDRQQVVICTSAIDEKCQLFEMLVLLDVWCTHCAVPAAEHQDGP